MNLDALRVKDPEELDGKEYKFLAEHKSELSAEEQEKFSLEVPEENNEEFSDEDRATLAAIKSGEKKVVGKDEEVVEKSRLDALEATAQDYKTEKAQEVVNKHIARGAIKQDASEFWTKQLLSSEGDDRKALEEQLAALPDNKILADEIGSGEDTPAGNTPREQLHVLANQKIAAAAKDGKELLYPEALKQATRENPDLAKADLQQNVVAGVGA